MDKAKKELTLRVVGMDCANCASTLERGLAQLEGIESVSVSFTTEKLTIQGDVSKDEVDKRVKALGYKVAEELLTEPGGGESLFTAMRQNIKAILAVSALVLLLSTGLLKPIIIRWLGSEMPIVGIHLLVIFLIGTPIASKGVRNLLVGRQITIDLLMSIATIGALFVRETGEAATVIVLFAVGEMLESLTASQARNSLQSLLKMAPDTATVLRECQDCAEHLGQGGYDGGPCPFCAEHEASVPVSQVDVGERVIVKPGERIPVDGLVVSGLSAVNQSPLTGESMPVTKAPGSDVYAGTINGEGVLEVKSTQPAEKSKFNRILALVEQAQLQRSPTERFIDRFAKWYTPAVVGVAVLTAVVPPLIFADAVMIDPGHPQNGWLYRALALLIVACPCALVISTPVTMVSSLTTLARQGVLVKGGAFLEALSGIRVFAFDKTGTLTLGKPAVVDARTPSCPPGMHRCEHCDYLLATAAAVEKRSEHPLAAAILQESKNRGVDSLVPTGASIEAMPGRGVKGLVDGSLIVVGSHSNGHSLEVDCRDLHQSIEIAEAQGHTVMLVSSDSLLLGFISVSDVPRSDSANVFRAIKDVDSSIRSVILTGDSYSVAEHVSRQIGGVDEIRAGLLPEGKGEIVGVLEEEYGPVAMVGDGVNDTPALAFASVGIAMGGIGTDQAMETADIVLMNDNLAGLVSAYKTSRFARRIIRQNIAFSLVVKAVFLALTLPGLATMWMAVFADMGASLLVTFNGMRALRRQN